MVKQTPHLISLCTAAQNTIISVTHITSEHFKHHPSYHYLCEKMFAKIKYSKVKVLVTQSYLTLCDLMDCSPLGSSVHGIHQARILEWVTILFSK